MSKYGIKRGFSNGADFDFHREDQFQFADCVITINEPIEKLLVSRAFLLPNPS